MELLKLPTRFRICVIGWMPARKLLEKELICWPLISGALEMFWRLLLLTMRALAFLAIFHPWDHREHQVCCSLLHRHLCDPYHWRVWKLIFCLEYLGVTWMQRLLLSNPHLIVPTSDHQCCEVNSLLTFLSLYDRWIHNERQQHIFQFVNKYIITLFYRYFFRDY